MRSRYIKKINCELKLSHRSSIAELDRNTICDTDEGLRDSARLKKSTSKGIAVKCLTRLSTCGHDKFLLTAQSSSVHCACDALQLD